MRAAFMAGPGDVRLGDFGVQCPREREVLVEMHHAAVCGSDVHHVFDGFQVQEMLGRPGIRLYDGSLSEWTQDPARPVETGPADADRAQV